MATKLLFGTVARAAATATAATASAGAATYFTDPDRRNADPVDKVHDAVAEFNKSSKYPAPENWPKDKKLFQIKNDFLKLPDFRATTATGQPLVPGPDQPLPGFDLKREAPWLSIDFKKEPCRYPEVVKEYCWEGNVDNEFDIWKNTIRPWLHAPWMHWGPTGREPVSGLTFERATPANEFSKTQNRIIQNWAIGFYNAIGATLFKQVWEDPSNPKFEKNLNFPLGSAVFKVLMTEATNDEFPFMAGAPAMQAVICPDSAMTGQGPPTPKNDKTTRLTNKEASAVRLVQVDWAVRDDRAPIGWVFGTFMYDKDKAAKNAWDKIIPVGLMWGEKPQEGWINPTADKIRQSVAGSIPPTRPSWGWNGRMNGPADNFISACASCHSTAQRDIEVNGVTASGMTFNAKKDNDNTRMKWFRNVPSGQPFDVNNLTADYSLQLSKGYQNWKNFMAPPASNFLTKTTKKFVFGEEQNPLPDQERFGVRYE